MPLAMRTDVIDQLLAIALHPAYDCSMAKVSMDVILNLTQSLKTHTYIVRSEVVESMLKVCERQKMINHQPLQTQRRKKEDPMTVNLLKYVLTSIAFYLIQHLSNKKNGVTML